MSSFRPHLPRIFYCEFVCLQTPATCVLFLCLSFVPPVVTVVLLVVNGSHWPTWLWLTQVPLDTSSIEIRPAVGLVIRVCVPVGGALCFGWLRYHRWPSCGEGGFYLWVITAVCGLRIRVACLISLCLFCEGRGEAVFSVPEPPAGEAFPRVSGLRDELNPGRPVGFWDRDRRQHWPRHQHSSLILEPPPLIIRAFARASCHEFSYTPQIMSKSRLTNTWCPYIS